MKIRIVISGFAGRMGSRIAVLAGHDPEFILVGGVVREILHQNFEEPLAIGLHAAPVMTDADVLIDFSEPQATVEHLLELSKNKAAVIGTTGFTTAQLEIIQKAARDIPIVLESNFSLGVAFLKLALASGLKASGESFDCEIVEVHRKGKRDSPSGTADDIAETLMPLLGEKPTISSLRMGEVPGEHTVYLTHRQEVLEFSHRVYSRDAFAVGALRAAKWVKGKSPGLYRLSDVLTGN